MPRKKKKTASRAKKTVKKRTTRKSTKTKTTKARTTKATRTKKEAEKDAAKFGVLIFPTKEEIIHKDRSKIDIVTNFLREEEIVYLDLYNALGKQAYFQHDKHFNKEGHKIVADQFFDFIISNFLPQKN